MPCCSALVALKRSSLKTQFFAHIARGGCKSTSETEEHRHLKWLAVMAARNHGWVAETEAMEITPSGEPWRADVLARKGKYKVAIEVQWSKQTNSETSRRQQRYRESGVRGVWLFRQSDFPITFDLPAVSIGGSLKGGFLALIPSYQDATPPSLRDRWHQVLPMNEFLDVVFRSRFQFGIPASSDATVAVRTALMPCWQPTCGAKTRILTGVEISFGPHECTLPAPVLAKHPEILRIVLNQLSENPRYSTNLSPSLESRECIGWSILRARSVLQSGQAARLPDQASPVMV
ncbi:competence protein CoiA family protein [Microvirga alba]